MQNVYDFIHEPLLFVRFRVSGKFLETAWRAVHCRQVAHAFLPVFGFLKRNHLTAPSLAARRHMALNPIFWVLDEGSGGDC